MCLEEECVASNFKLVLAAGYMHGCAQSWITCMDTYIIYTTCPPVCAVCVCYFFFPLLEKRAFFAYISGNTCMHASVVV
jgi:hypothetical protein